MIKIGFSQCDFFLEKNYPSNLAIGNGILIFNGYANMGAGCKMSLNMGGYYKLAIKRGVLDLF